MAAERRATLITQCCEPSRRTPASAIRNERGDSDAAVGAAASSSACALRGKSPFNRNEQPVEKSLDGAAKPVAQELRVPRLRTMRSAIGATPAQGSGPGPPTRLRAVPFRKGTVPRQGRPQRHTTMPSTGLTWLAD